MSGLNGSIEHDVEGYQAYEFEKDSRIDFYDAEAFLFGVSIETPSSDKVRKALLFAYTSGQRSGERVGRSQLQCELQRLINPQGQS